MLTGCIARYCNLSFRIEDILETEETKIWVRSVYCSWRTSRADIKDEPDCCKVRLHRRIRQR